MYAAYVTLYLIAYGKGVSKSERMKHIHNMTRRMSNIQGTFAIGLLLGLILPTIIVVVGSSQVNATTRVVQEVSTGDETACAVVNYNLQCWGSNSDGQLGIGVKGGKKTSPVQVNVAGTALAGKSIRKVAVGTRHTCALSEARVYCWGENGSGQLGTRANADSTKPVAVDTKKAWLEVIPAHCNGYSNFLTGCAIPTGTWVAEQRVNHAASSLYQKEVVDITAGDDSSCALASDGTVSCWGNGTDGRLGNGSESNTNIPKFVTGAVSGQKIAELARAKADAVCAIGSNAKTYCWGKGVGDGAVPANEERPCGSGTTTNPFSDTSSTVYFDALQSREVPSVPQAQRSIDVTNDSYVTAVGTNGRAYYWGLHGYIKRVKADFWRSCQVKTGSSGLDSTGGMCSGGHGKPGCGSGSVGHYGEDISYVEVGNDTPQGPLYNGAAAVNAFNQKALTITSGNGYKGLFCGLISTGLYCDPNGTKTTSGQAGNNSTANVTGAQKVYADGGWLTGKTPSLMDTGNTGNKSFTCAATTDSVACWGVGGSGQLGNGSTSNKSVPTQVNLVN